jgi:hypothetical protein
MNEPHETVLRESVGLHVLGRVLVLVGRNRDRAVPEPFGDDLERDAFLKEQGCRRVTKIVQPDPR